MVFSQIGCVFLTDPQQKPHVSVLMKTCCIVESARGSAWACVASRIKINHMGSALSSELTVIYCTVCKLKVNVDIQLLSDSLCPVFDLQDWISLWGTCLAVANISAVVFDHEYMPVELNQCWKVMWCVFISTAREVFVEDRSESIAYLGKTVENVRYRDLNSDSPVCLRWTPYPNVMCLLADRSPV